MSKKFDTRLIHDSNEVRPMPTARGVAPSPLLSTTFVRDDPRNTDEYIYSRTDNPGRRHLEQRIASLEDGADAVAFATGSAASMALFKTLPPSSHVLVTADAYYGTVLQLNQLVTRMGHTVTAVDTTDIDAIDHAWQDNTALVWLETPSNPQMRISDIQAVTDYAHARRARVCCDNTVATSVWQQPLAHGADFSMHSSTKYLGGHSDVMGGIIITAQADESLSQLREVQQMGGAVPSPFDCWLLLRSIATLGVRVRRQSATAQFVAEQLGRHPGVEQVLYAGLDTHPGFARNQQQMASGGALLSVLVAGDANAAIRVAQSTQLITQATSLGGVESLIEHRYSVEGATSISPPNLLRLSMGLEDPEDLLADLTQAIDQALQ